MRKYTYPQSGASLQRHASRPLPRKGTQTTQSEPGASYSGSHRWLDLGLVCTALAVMFTHSNFLF